MDHFEGMKHFLPVLFLYLATFLTGCSALPRLTVVPEMGPDAPALTALADEAAHTGLNLHSVLVSVHGRLVLELYRNGWDTSLSRGGGVFSGWTDLDADSVHDVRSTTKSVVALLAGTVLARHPEFSVHTRVAEFPELADRATTATGDLELADLLGMTSGLAWKEWGRPFWDSDETPLVWESDPIRYALNRRLADPPGTRFVYSGGATQVAARMLELMDGRPLTTIAQDDLWGPLGITEVRWGRSSSGEVLAFAGLGLRPRDMLKLGQLVNNLGLWQGQRVVPAEWVNAMTSPRVQTDTSLFDLDSHGTFYGYGWWNGSISTASGTVRWTSTIGNGGQRIFLVPDRGLVVVLTAGAYGDRAIQSWETDFLGRLVNAVSTSSPKHDPETAPAVPQTP